jgi:ribonuclease HI
MQRKCGAQGPGRLGAIISQRGEYAKTSVEQADTSKNEIELTATLKALAKTPLDSYVLVETDSQLCIDMVTAYAKRRGNNGWRKPNGQLAANVQLIEPLMRMMEVRRVDSRKVKGHERDEWDTRADKLAAMGRSRKAKEICVKIAMKIRAGQDLRYFGVDRFHVRSLDNLRDIWPNLKEGAHMSLGG